MQLKFDAKGLIPAVAQDVRSGEVLMVAWMDRESIQKTMETRKVHYYSRTRRALWLKGETSGHFQHVEDILVDCDGDTLLLKVRQDGVACHTGNPTCFYRSLDRVDEDGEKPAVMPEPDTGAVAPSDEAGNLTEHASPAAIPSASVLAQVYAVIMDRKARPREGSYTSLLFSRGLDRIVKKVGEEAAEVIIAAKNRDKNEICYETADLLYHLMVMMADAGVEWEDIFAELDKRR
ncbi:MAG TPA: bifunctional phosphoribosyl-AMP cyclohydrolase/phosphoribosyl-ATP diphosphatase [Clostridiales bacterium]|nr:bifunctional phosphoribosyl-AMP cyclohydrolase/phosphoribosyl-ATP diphosphatase [Clostridiales bacterium]